MNTLTREIKIACREKIKRYKNHFCIVEEHPMAIRLEFIGSHGGCMFSFPQYDEEGDPLTDEKTQEIKSAVKAIIDEHNASLPAPSEEDKGVVNKIKSWFGG